MPTSDLPSDKQREAICDLIASAFIELRHLEGEQAHDLAYAFHNLPKEIYGWGTWSEKVMRSRLAYYQGKHKANPGLDYVAVFDAIFSVTPPQYVGFWLRMVATGIDTVLLLLIIVPAMMAIYGPRYLLQDSLILGPVDFMISYVGPFLIQLALWITFSTTPGKMAVGAIIVDAKTGGKPSPGQFFKRGLGIYLSAIPLCLGFICIGFDPRKRGLHDRIAETLVIKRARASS